MTVVTFSKYISFTNLLHLNTTIWNIIRSVRIEATEFTIASTIVAFINAISSEFFQRKFTKPLKKAFNKSYQDGFEWFQSKQDSFITFLHLTICNGPKTKHKMHSKARKIRRRTSAGSQWRLKHFKVRLRHPHYVSHCPTVLPITASMAEQQINKGLKKERTRFDTGSSPVGMDTQASRSICIDRRMMRNLRPVNIRVLGIANTKTVCKWQGDWVLPITDDNGITTIEIIPNTPLVPDGAKSILSPQHFAKKYPPTSRARQLCTATQYHNRCIFCWGEEGERILTIRNDNSDVPIFYSTADINSFNAFMENSNHDDDALLALETTVTDESDYTSAIPIVSDDEASIDNDSTATEGVIPKDPSQNQEINLSKTDNADQEQNLSPAIDENKTSPLTDDKIYLNKAEENLHNFSKSMPHPNDILPDPQDIESRALSDASGFLRWHYKLNHLSFHKMKALATLGVIPRKYRHCKPPICKACQYGKQRRKPLRSKGQRHHIRKVQNPGQCVSIDQMESSLGGFVAQLKGRLTKRRYIGATVFRDHATGFIHVALMTDFTGQATVDACNEFEVLSRNMGVDVKHYHCDNGRFADSKFISHCKHRHISVTYCGVNAHHQNGVAERTIGILRDEARVALWHAVFRWPSMLLLNLWPYAIRNAAEIRNSLPSSDSGLSPLEMYSNSSVGTNFNDFHT